MEAARQSWPRLVAFLKGNLEAAGVSELGTTPAAGPQLAALDDCCAGDGPAEANLPARP
jgi:hypothetical protein